MIPTKDQARQAVAVLGAIELAVVGAPDAERAVEVVTLLLGEMPTGVLDEGSHDSVDLLVRLLRERRLQATVALGQERPS